VAYKAMTPELWERLKPHFHQAVELPSAERDVFVAKLCTEEPELAHDLIGLLRAHEEKTGAIRSHIFNLNEVLAAKASAFFPGHTLLGRFQIVRHVGSGGMGDVYEALDLELGQTIALKTIRPDIAGDEAALSRFKKEVQLARRVTGPNVCRIHELFLASSDSTEECFAFLTMELLEGVTLSERIREQGPVPWRQAEAITSDICSGLSAIHSAGIVHRDLKSRNIMLAKRDGIERAVLMDFGLAHELYPAITGETGLSRPGVICGTPEYMAPEQFEGKQVSPATDVYALGVVLYELVTGEHPFASSTPVGAAVRRGKRPEPVSSIQRSLPHRWDEVISKCLEFEADRRYQSAAEVIRALRTNHFGFNRSKLSWSGRLAAGVSPVLLLPCLLMFPALRERLQGTLLASHQKHIAVLPFEVGDGKAETGALGDGLMDSLSGRLANLDAGNQSLWVVPASEVRSSKVNDASAALRELGATIAVKGRVSQHDQTVHLSLEVIDGKEKREIGSVDLEDAESNVAALEDEAVLRISRLINVRQAPESNPEPERPKVRAAYEEYLTAIGYLERYDKAGNLDRAISVLNRLIETDKSFSLGYAKMAEAYRLKYQLDQNPTWIEKADQYIGKAAELGTNIPAIHITIARIQEAFGNNDLAIQEFQHALNLDSRDAEALGGLANAYKRAGRIKDAEDTFKKAIALRPDYWDGYDELGNFYDDQGRHKEAIAQFDHALKLTPDNAQVYLNLGATYIDDADPNDQPLAEQVLQKSLAIGPSYAAYANLGTLYGAQKRYSQAAAMTEKALQLNDHNYIVWANLAIAYEWLNESGKANAARKEMLTRVKEHLAKKSKDAEARSSLALLLAHDGEKVQAIENIQTALALAQDNPVVLSNVADAYELLGSRPQAIAYLSKAMKKGMSESDLRADPYLRSLTADPRFHLSP
jgi:eukaryotic-like serine/threonine-protein kinase